MKYLLTFIGMVLVIACSVALWMNFALGERAGARYRVELHSGGQVARTWETDTNVPYHLGHGFARFTDKATGKRICVGGNVVVTPLD